MTDTMHAAEQSLNESLDDLARAQPAGTPDLPSGVSDGVDRYCQAARAGGLKAEETLVRLKAMVRRAYLERDPDRLTAASVVWKAVQRCVKAFYAPDHANRPAR